MAFGRVSRGLAAVGFLGAVGAFGSPAQAAPATGPSLAVVWAGDTCATQPYQMQGHISGFPPNQATVLTFRDKASGFQIDLPVTTDGNGDGTTLPYPYAGQGNPSEPWAAWAEFHRDDNNNGQIDSGEPLILGANITAHQPCQDATVAPK